MYRTKLTKAVIQKDIVIKLHFEGGAWANMSFIFTPKDENHSSDWWRVAINSDWGSWTYSWGRSGMGGRNIFQFMDNMSSDKSYFIRHFMGPENAVFSARKTCTILRKKIKEEFPWVRERHVNQDLMWQVSQLEHYETDEEFLDALRNQSGMLIELAGDEFFRELVYETKGTTAYFFKHVFPKFFKEIKKLAKEKQYESDGDIKVHRGNKGGDGNTSSRVQLKKTRTRAVSKEHGAVSQARA